MLKGELSGRLGQLKNNLNYVWLKLSENDFEVARNGISRFVGVLGSLGNRHVKPGDIHLENYQYESHRIDDLPLTIIKDPGPGIKYSYTENSEFARVAEKTEAVGLDKFGDENDTFDTEAADDYQDFRNRHQNSDLDQRYYTRGLHRDIRSLE
jgi:hypothetical protein